VFLVSLRSLIVVMSLVSRVLIFMRRDCSCVVYWTVSRRRPLADEEPPPQHGRAYFRRRHAFPPSRLKRRGRARIRRRPSSPTSRRLSVTASGGRLPRRPRGHFVTRASTPRLSARVPSTSRYSV